MSDYTKTLKTILPEILCQVETLYPDRGYKIWEKWDEIVGLELSSRTAPAELKKGKLTIAVSSAPWMSQLVFLGPQIVEKINAIIGQPVVKEIKCKLGEVKKVEFVMEQAPDLDSAKLTGEEETLVQGSVEGIEDDELKKAVLGAMVTGLKRSKL